MRCPSRVLNCWTLPPRCPRCSCRADLACSQTRSWEVRYGVRKRKQLEVQCICCSIFLQKLNEYGVTKASAAVFISKNYQLEVTTRTRRNSAVHLNWPVVLASPSRRGRSFSSPREGGVQCSCKAHTRCAPAGHSRRSDFDSKSWASRRRVLRALLLLAARCVYSVCSSPFRLPRRAEAHKGTESVRRTQI